MNILLDTHIALWAIGDSPKLPAMARDLILTPTNQLWVSAASLWEITIKHALGRGDMPVSGKQALDYFQQSGYRLLPITAEHTIEVGTLPLHHQDPFDRILVAQALSEPLRLLTHDTKVAAYSSTIILV
ncbi:MAG: type II toxin-antitoxin system VapC family toxin [Corticimicrobacter sp.]|uniref:type II toxin-antitoxin system VapC family toxin n=1 Tax=Corticimicrobacter sp. TaxID=2678536 RepID=UPI0032DA76BF